MPIDLDKIEKLPGHRWHVSKWADRAWTVGYEQSAGLGYAVATSPRYTPEAEWREIAEGIALLKDVAAELREAREVMAANQWSAERVSNYGLTATPICPECHCSEDEGHAACRLAALLEPTTKETQA